MHGAAVYSQLVGVAVLGLEEEDMGVLVLVDEEHALHRPSHPLPLVLRLDSSQPRLNGPVLRRARPDGGKTAGK